ncbi:MAG: tripartite tricarboxylate transporter substrate-binding protein [Dehalobacterium sp.]
MMQKKVFPQTFCMFIMLMFMVILFTGCSASQPEQEGTAEQAGGWPPAQMEIVLPHEVGSNHDVVTRALGEIWQEHLGTKFIYNNKDGAGNRIGYDFFQQQPKDGSVIMSSNIVTAAIMYAEQKPDWVWEDTLVPLDVFSVDPGAIFVTADSKYQDFNQLINEAKSHKLTIAISQWASAETLLLQQIMELTGAQFELIPFGSGTDLITQVLGGHVDCGFGKVSGIEKIGDMKKYLAVAMPTNPVPDLTDNVKTIDELLGSETMPVASYRGIMVHKEFKEKYPEEYEKLRESLREAKKDPKFIEQAPKLDMNPELIIDMEPAEIEKMIQEHWNLFEKYKAVFQQK